MNIVTPQETVQFSAIVSIKSFKLLHIGHYMRCNVAL